MQYQFKKHVTITHETRAKHAHLSDRDLLLIILERINHVADQTDTNASALAEVTAEVAQELSVTASLRTLLGAVKTDLDKEIALLSSQVPIDAVAGLKALSAQLTRDVADNAAAILANTPAAAVDPAQSAPPPAVQPAVAPPPPTGDATSTTADPGASSTSMTDSPPVES